MQRFMLKSKLHRVTVTNATSTMKAASPSTRRSCRGDLMPCEKVDIYNVSNGSGFSTYVIKGKKGSGVICLNGAAARKASKGM